MAQHIDYDEEAKYRTWWLNNTGGTAAQGLTVRDYFAAKAMVEMTNYFTDEDKVAQHAYQLADAMMKERAK